MNNVETKHLFVQCLHGFLSSINKQKLLAFARPEEQRSFFIHIYKSFSILY